MTDRKELHIVADAIGILSALAVLIGFGLMFYMVGVDHDPPFETTAVKIYDSLGGERYTFNAGETITLYREFCVKRDIPVTIGRMFRNVNTKVGLQMDSTTQKFSKGCGSGGNIIHLPDYMPPGKYKYTVTVAYPDNSFHDEVTEMTPVYIEIIPRMTK